MVKAIIFLGTCALAGRIMAQPNNTNFNNSNLSNVFVSNNNVNVNVQTAVNINVQQSFNVNTPKPVTVNQTRRRTVSTTTPKPKSNTTSQTRRRTVSTSTPKPSNVNTQATVRRPTRARRPSTQTNTATANVAPVQVAPVQAANEDNVNVANVNNTQEFVENQAPQQQILFTNFNPVQTNKQNKNDDNVNENDNQGVSINLPTFKKPQIYFSYADLSVTHKSVSLKKMISQKLMKASRKHKAKHSGRIKRYITHNCCKWN